MCANFIHNYYREIYLLDEDGRAKRYRFCDSLKNINELREECDEPRFLFGAIFRVEKFKGHSNIWLRIDNSTPYRDFRIRITNDTAEGRGFLNDRNLGRIAMFYSKVNGAGLGFITPELGWGEVALLPDKYDDFLNRVYHEDDTDN